MVYVRRSWEVRQKEDGRQQLAAWCELLRINSIWVPKLWLRPHAATWLEAG